MVLAQQRTSRTTPVPVDAIAGAIKLCKDRGSAQPTTFSVRNPLVTRGDLIALTVAQSENTYAAFVTDVDHGRFDVTIFALIGDSVDEPTINFRILAD